MPARPPGVYQDSRGKWYFKVTVGQDPLTGKRDQVTRRGFATMAEASKERREVLNQIDRGQLARRRPVSRSTSSSISTSTEWTPTRTWR